MCDGLESTSLRPGKNYFQPNFFLPSFYSTPDLLFLNSYKCCTGYEYVGYF